ncbi:MAG: DUF1028 domain-containing protein [Bacteroidetes bacterium]|nr:DUF1028 domain-containing protein [Bacteroidota bacterium]
MKTKKALFLLICITQFLIDANAQTFFSKEPLAHTFSIVARDTITGEMGVAVQSHWFSVGSIVTWGEAGVGVVATQSFVNPAFGPQGLALLKNGLTPEQAVKMLTTNDDGRDVRQLAILDGTNKPANYTGKKCIPAAGGIVGKDFAVQANLMANDKVWPAMEKAFRETKGPLAERMVAALEAAQGAGGDIRGKQSAALLVVKGKSTGKVWEDRLIDLRIEDNPNPIAELKRVLKVHRAYDHMNAGDLAIEHGDMALAMKEYSTAEKMFPGNLEMKYWHAVTLTNIGKLEEALPMFKEVFAKDKNWAILTPRLVKVDQLQVNEEELKKIMDQQ